MPVINFFAGLICVPVAILLIAVCRLVKGRVWAARVFAGVDLSTPHTEGPKA